MVIASTATGCVAHQEAGPMHWGGPLVSATLSQGRTVSGGVVKTKKQEGVWCVLGKLRARGTTLGGFTCFISISKNS